MLHGTTKRETPCRHYRRLVAAAIGLSWYFLATVSTGAAGPWAMVVEGDLLPERIVMGKWEELQQVLLTRRRAQEYPDERRQHLVFHIFWDTKWMGWVVEGKPLDELRPENASLHLRFYPACEDHPAVTTTDPPIPQGYIDPPPADVVGETGLELLRQNGVPVRLDGPCIDTTRSAGWWAVRASIVLVSLGAVAALSVLLKPWRWAFR